MLVKKVYYLLCFLLGVSSFNSFLFSKVHSLNQYECTQVSFIYGDQSEDLPNLLAIDEAELNLSFSDTPIKLKNLIMGTGYPFQLNLIDIHRIGEVPMHYLKSLGYEGLVVFPDPLQIDPVSGKDLRKEGDQELRFVIWVSRLQKVELEKGEIKQSVFLRLQGALEKRGTRSSPKKPITSEDIRFWNRFGRAPSRHSKVILSPGDQPGNVIVVLKPRPKDRSKFSFQGSNSGTSTTGKWILGGSYLNNQISGADDRFSLSYLSSDTGEREAYMIIYQRPILYPDILELGLSLGYSNYDASSFAVTKIDFAGDTQSIDLFADWKPLSTEFENYSLSFQIGLKAEQVKASNSLISGEADASIITPRFAIKLSTEGKYLQTQTELSVRGNIHSIKESDQALLGGVNTRGKFEKLSFTYLESLKLGKWLHDEFFEVFPVGWSDQILITRAQGDLALRDQRHLPQHQFIAGGTGSVRGYPESPVAGDSGYLISFDYRMPLPPVSFMNGENLKSTLIPFVDWGETFSTDPLFYESDHSILGAGIGLELNLPGGGMARIDFAQPLREIVNNGNILEGTRSNDHRLHAMIRWEF